MKLKQLLLPVLFVCGLFCKAAPPEKTDFKIRGFHLDLRIQVMKMQALKAFALKLSKNGINTLVMEWEGTFPFHADPLISNRYAYSTEEVKDFIQYCKQLKIDVVPLQQSFGHVEYILRHEKYAAVRESDKDFSQVCPTEAALNKELFTRLFKEMVSLHPSKYFHIGGDETYLLGHCEKCKKRAAEIGLSRLYFDHIKMLCDIVISLGKQPVMWADIALHHPEFIKLLPKQTILIDWNYGWDLNYFGDHQQLLNSGYEIWGSPSIRSSPDNYFLTRWAYHFGNIRDFVPVCRKSGYTGIVMTSWSTSGQYAAVRESERDFVELIPLRQVYPISGFDLLLEAYFKAIDGDSLRVNEFIPEYCKEKFGFDAQESSRFMQALFVTPYTIVNEKADAPGEISIKAMVDSVQQARDLLYALRPKTNDRLFEHYRLMNDIRLFYLQYRSIEQDVNAPNVTADQIPTYISRLKTLINTEGALNKRFVDLNKEVLFPAALEQENTLRNQKLQMMLDRLSKSK